MRERFDKEKDSIINLTVEELQESSLQICADKDPTGRWYLKDGKTIIKSGSQVEQNWKKLAIYFAKGYIAGTNV